MYMIMFQAEMVNAVISIIVYIFDVCEDVDFKYGNLYNVIFITRTKNAVSNATNNQLSTLGLVCPYPADQS